MSTAEDHVKLAEDVTRASMACANWWADHVFAGTPGRISDGSDRDANFSEMLALVAGVQGRPQPNDDKRGAFVNALGYRVATSLMRMASFDRDYEPSVTVGVDYGPDLILSEAAEEAGLSRPNFPWKTMTWTYPSHFVASLGYGAPSKLIWAAEDWERPQCRTPNYDEKTFERLPWVCSGLTYHEDDHTFDIPQALCHASVKGNNGVFIEKCNHPENDEWHRIHPDGYTSPLYHQFSPEPVAVDLTK